VSEFEVLIRRSPTTVSPRVTVIITLFNYEQHIIECLESVRAQTLADLDLVVIDDASTDSSTRLAQNWMEAHASRFDACQLIRHRTNQGPSVGRNTAISLARTKHVFVLDADNIIYPRCLARLLAGIEMSKASFAYALMERFGALGTLPHDDRIPLRNTMPWNPAAFSAGFRVDTMVLMRKSLWEDVSGYTVNEIVRWGWEDFDFFLKVARAGYVGVLVPELLTRYRVHPSSREHTSAFAHSDALWEYVCSTYPEYFD
jgi:glycosyltransferase involved in cell wall biosynthesis